MTVREFGNWLLDLSVWQVTIFLVGWYFGYKFTEGFLNGMRKARRPR